jgi:hypothetical protein
MGRSMTNASDALELKRVAAPVVLFSAKLNRYFKVYREGASSYQAEYELNAAGETVFEAKQKLEYVIGSGVNGYGFIVRRGDYLFEAPLSYYSQVQKWGLSPGYESLDYGFSRPVPPNCLACHSGQPDPVLGRQGLYRDPPFRELAIGCENCHGPGQLHVAERAKGIPVASSEDLSIVNPARLPARLAEEICMNCHQSGDARVLQPGKNYLDFRPGAWLDDTVSIIKMVPARDEPDLLNHHSALRGSKCYQASGGKLTCLNCHDPHAKASREDARAHYRSKCMTCHSEASCRLPIRSRVERLDDCVSCHMPKRDVTGLPHSALTNHRIRTSHSQGHTEPSQELSVDITHFNRPPGEARKDLSPLTLLKAYGELMYREPRFRQRYLVLLKQLENSSPNDSFVQVALGRIALRESEPDSNARAIERLSKGIELGSTLSAAYQDLAEALSRAGRTEDAVGILRRGIALEPYAPVLYKVLVQQYIKLRWYSQAKQTAKTYIDIFPQDSFMRALPDQIPAP